MENSSTALSCHSVIRQADKQFVPGAKIGTDAAGHWLSSLHKVPSFALG